MYLIKTMGFCSVHSWMGSFLFHCVVVCIFLCGWRSTAIHYNNFGHLYLSNFILNAFVHSGLLSFDMTFWHLTFLYPFGTQNTGFRSQNNNPIIIVFFLYLHLSDRSIFLWYSNMFELLFHVWSYHRATTTTTTKTNQISRIDLFWRIGNHKTMNK